MEKDSLPLMEAGKMMHMVFRVFKKRAEGRPDQGERITAEQFSLLHAISMKAEDVIQQDMAEMMGKDKSAILRLIDSLEKKNLVRRVVDMKDRRKNCLIVTKAGARVIEEHLEIGEELMHDLHKGISEKDVKIFRKVVRLITKNAEELQTNS